MPSTIHDQNLSIDQAFRMTSESLRLTPPPADDHKGFMGYAFDRACLTPPASIKVCAGTVPVDADKKVLSTNYLVEVQRGSRRDPENTHAEQCCLIKVAQNNGLPEERFDEVRPKNPVLYMTMEPLDKRLTENRACVERIPGLNGVVIVVHVGRAWNFC